MRIGRSLTVALLAAMSLPGWGCGLAPHSFRKLQHPAALVRARSVGLGPRDADPQVVPALVNRLEDEDPVVRMAANEELRKRTGQDFGFVAWASPEERAGAIARWRSWLTAPPMPADPIKSPGLPAESESSQAVRRPARRRRGRAPSPPTATPAPPTSEKAPS